MNHPRHLGRAALALMLGLSVPAAAYVGFVTVAPSQGTMLTIYNKADLTLARDRRTVVLKKGTNALRFEWAGTLIDPTSLVAFPPSGVRVKNTTYPLDHGEALVWEMAADAQTSGTLGVQYFTSGLSWAADHMVTLTSPGRAALETWVTVRNSSGEDYPNAQFRLVVGEVRLVERIADLARRFKAEASGYAEQKAARAMVETLAEEAEADDMAYPAAAPPSAAGRSMAAERPRRAKSVERESLSELHLYNIEGTESVPNGGARRMRAFSWKDVAVRDVYRCVNPMGLVDAQRVVAFKNTRDNRMGTQPLPEGRVLLYRARSEGPSLDGMGQAPYVPMGEEGEVPVGTTPGVTCEAYVKNRSHRALDKDSLGRIRGWEDVTDWEVKLVNGSPDEAAFEVRQNHEAPFASSLKEARQEDTTTLLLTQKLGGFEKKVFRYQVTTRRGTLAQKGR